MALCPVAAGFGVGSPSSSLRQQQQQRQTTLFSTTERESAATDNTGFGSIMEERGVVEKEFEGLSSAEIKEKLLDLVPRMMGSEEEFRLVESYVNALESDYTPPQTLDFLNLAMGGEWQLLFSTNLRGGVRPNFRLTEMLQKVEPGKLEGTVTNVAQWDLAQQEGIFDCSGTFSAVCDYTINQGARMVMELKDHKIELARGSKVPDDIQGLVGMIHRSMPTELFDPSEHAADTTYLDVDLRITRMTGSKFEGVRDILIRKGSMEINPVGVEE